MNERKPRPIYMGDFETTVYEGQTFTEVWASALTEIGTGEVLVFNSLEKTYDFILSQKTDLIIYYHNLKFDGTFWLSFLFRNGFKNGFILPDVMEWKKDAQLNNKEVKYIISDKGQWYKIIFKIGGHKIELRDSLKLLPFSVKRIGESFGTKHKKLDIEYAGFRAAGGEITEEEQQYIRNDVLVVAEALELMFSRGHKNLTIGSCCLSEYRKHLELDIFHEWKTLFPDMTKIELTKKWDIELYDD